jgi:hypothetical protein
MAEPIPTSAAAKAIRRRSEIPPAQQPDEREPIPMLSEYGCGRRSGIEPDGWLQDGGDQLISKRDQANQSEVELKRFFE